MIGLVISLAIQAVVLMVQLMIIMVQLMIRAGIAAAAMVASLIDQHSKR